MKARLYNKYMNEVRPALIEKRKYKNVHEVPKMEKIVKLVYLAVESLGNAATRPAYVNPDPLSLR